MAKNIKRHITHIKSNVVDNGKPKLPQADDIELGEIAVNYADGYETISIKSTTSSIKQFSSDEYYTKQKLGEDFTGENSGKTVTDALTEVDAKKTDVSAFTAHTASTSHMTSSEKENLDSLATNIGTISGITSEMVSGWNTASEDAHTHANKAVLDSVTAAYTSEEKTKLGNVEDGAQVNVIETIKVNGTPLTPTDKTVDINVTPSQHYHASNEITAMTGYQKASVGDAITTGDTLNLAIGKLEKRLDDTIDNDFFNGVEYGMSGETHVINFYHNDTLVDTINADAFIKDGMVDNVVISGGNLVITFNTDSGKEAISIPLTDIFDPSNYYTKTEVDTALAGKADTATTYTKSEVYSKTEIDNLVGTGFSSSSITDVFNENEEIIATALTDLDARKLDASAYTPTDLSNYYAKDETSGKTEIQTALDEKVNADDVVTAITPLNSGSTGPIATCVVAENEAVVTSALNDLEASIDGKQNALSAGRGISIENDTVAFTLPISAGTGLNSIIEGSGTTADGDCSHAEGDNTTTNGYASHAEGLRTVANGECSHAEGDHTNASGYASHAEGDATVASGENSHAEGSGTMAILDNSHAEGFETVASGRHSHTEGHATSATTYASHAEGSGTTAAGENSHSEGDSTNANGNASHAEGNSTVADGESSHAEGYNTDASGEYSHAEGSGTTASNECSHAEGYNTKARGLRSHAEGDSTIASGQSSHAEGDTTVASGDLSHAEGGYTLASGVNSHAEGNESVASGNCSHAEGTETHANGDSSHAEGQETNAIGDFSHAEGFATSGTGENSHAEGDHTNASGYASHAEGNATTADGEQSHAEGFETIASGASSHAEGGDTTANGECSHAEGSNTIADGYYSHAEGSNTEAKNQSEHASGRYNVSSSASTAFGDSGNTLFSVGNGTNSNARHNAFEIRQNGDIYIVKNGSDVKLQDQLGGGSSYTAGSGIDITNNVISVTGKQDTLSEGRGISISNNSVGITLPISAGTGTNSIIEGSGHAEGDGTTASGSCSHAEGDNTVANNESEHASGRYNVSSSASTTFGDSGNTLFSVGNGNFSERHNAFEIRQNGDIYFALNNMDVKLQDKLTDIETSIGGKQNVLTAGRGISIENNTVNFIFPISSGEGVNSIAEGSETRARGESSHAEGGDTQANGNTSHADYASHAEGSGTTASGNCSHAEGSDTIASGVSSHAEGSETRSIGDCSHSEGHRTAALGLFSHSEGFRAIASGASSHAEGGDTTANGEYSHAEGYNTIAKNKAEHAGGQFNVSSSASTTFGDGGNTLFSVGDGTADDARHNAFEIRQNGDIYIELGGQDVKLQDKLTTVTAITPSNSGSTDPIATCVVAENDAVTASALTDLDERTTANTTALGGLSLVKLTQAQYDALATKDSNTLYVIVG